MLNYKAACGIEQLNKLFIKDTSTVIYNHLLDINDYLENTNSTNGQKRLLKTKLQFMRRDFLECREKLSKISITNSDFSILTPQHEIDFYLNNFKNIKEILLFEFGNKEICNLIDKIINEDISNEEYSNDITKLRNNSSYMIRRLKNYIDYISKE